MALVLPKHSLDGARAKLSRAQHHFEQLDSAIKAWEGTIKDSDRSSFKFDPDRKTLTILANNTRPPDPTWALVIGDIVHNLRSALDHIVCRLALLIGNPIECCEETSFPICDTPAAFKNAKRRIKPLISSEALTLIQKCQPYYASE